MPTARKANKQDPLVLYVDPGEDTGWALGCGKLLVAAGTTKMWEFADEVHGALQYEREPAAFLLIPMLKDPESVYVREGMAKYLDRPIEHIVCEDWRLYPDKLRALAWDQCRTARLIGALTLITRIYRLGWTLQPAAIKIAAVAAGAEELYYRPLHENRHQNDAIQHFVYFTTYGPEGDPRTPNNVSNSERDSS